MTYFNTENRINLQLSTMKSPLFLIITSCSIIFNIFSGCSSNQTKYKNQIEKKKTKIVSKVKSKKDSLFVRGMVLIPSGIFNMGAEDNQGFEDEYPKHKVKINSFWIDETEVTNSQFKKFVDETGYVTTAEKKIDWEVAKVIKVDYPDIEIETEKKYRILQVNFDKFHKDLDNNK